MSDIRVLLVSGSTRAGSTNSFVLEALRELRLPGIVTDSYDGLVALPAFVPGDAEPALVVDLLERIAAADAVLFSTPEYAGGLPGSLKNLLDWTVGGGQLYGKPVAWLDVANPGRGQGARAQLRTVLGYVGARIVDAACVHVMLQRVDGRVVLDPSAAGDLSAAVAALVGAVEESSL